MPEQCTLMSAEQKRNVHPSISEFNNSMKLVSFSEFNISISTIYKFLKKRVVSIEVPKLYRSV